MIYDMITWNVKKLNILFLFLLPLLIYSKCPFHTFKRSLSDNILWNKTRLFSLESDWSEKQTWIKKLDRIWDEITSSPQVPNTNPSVAEFFFRLLLVTDDFSRLRLPLTFRPYDNLKKVLHTAGSYGRIKLRWTDNKFREENTGLFSEPEIEGIMTGSGGNPYVGNQSVAYGWGFKFFRTNSTPGHILTLNGFLGIGAYWNTFGYMTCNHASLAEMAILLPNVLGWSRYPNQMGLSNMAEYTLEGIRIKKPRFPYSLCFIPNLKIQKRIGSPTTGTPLQSIHTQLSLINKGEKLFSIVAVMDPKVLENTDLLYNSLYTRKVGDVYLKDGFFTSQYGDSRIFFQHQLFEEDLVFKPEWLPYITINNLIREGALGTYRILFPPPVAELTEQLNALNTVKLMIKKLFTDPVKQIDTIKAILGFSSIFDLTRTLLKQGGPSSNIIIRGISGDLNTGFNYTLRWIKTILPYKNYPLEGLNINSIKNSNSYIFSTFNFFNNYFSKNILPWPKSVPYDLRTTDPFLLARQRHLYFTSELINYYKDINNITEKDELKVFFNELINDIINSETNIPTMSLINLFNIPIKIIKTEIYSRIRWFIKNDKNIYLNNLYSNDQLIDNLINKIKNIDPKLFIINILPFILDLINYNNLNYNIFTLIFNETNHNI